MDLKNEIEALEKRVDEIKKELSELGEMHPGSLSVQYNVCGNPTCACKNPIDPKKHGPYNQLSFSRKGKSSTRFIKDVDLKQVRQKIDNYKKFKQLTEEWIDISVEIANLRKKLAAKT